MCMSWGTWHYNRHCLDALGVFEVAKMELQFLLACFATSKLKILEVCCWCVIKSKPWILTLAAIHRKRSLPQFSNIEWWPLTDVAESNQKLQVPYKVRSLYGARGANNLCSFGSYTFLFSPGGKSLSTTPTQLLPLRADARCTPSVDLTRPNLVASESD